MLKISMRDSNRHHYSVAILDSSHAFLNASKRSLSSMAAAREGDGVILKRLITGAQIRPEGVLCVPPLMMINTLRGFEAWEKLEGTEWVPFEVNPAWLRFTTPQDDTLSENTHIGHLQLEVSVIVSREDHQAWEEKPPVDLAHIHTPSTPRSSASSTR